MDESCEIQTAQSLINTESKTKKHATTEQGSSSGSNNQGHLKHFSDTANKELLPASHVLVMSTFLKRDNSGFSKGNFHNCTLDNHCFYVAFFVVDWRADGYRWFQYGNKHIPRKDHVFKKVQFATALHTGQYDRRFRRQVFLPLKDDHCVHVLIHY